MCMRVLHALKMFAKFSFNSQILKNKWISPSQHSSRIRWEVMNGRFVIPEILRSNSPPPRTPIESSWARRPRQSSCCVPCRPLHKCPPRSSPAWGSPPAQDGLSSREALPNCTIASSWNKTNQIESTPITRKPRKIRENTGTNFEMSLSPRQIRQVIAR